MGLQEKFQNDRISQLQIRKPVTVTKDTTLRDAVALMRQHNIGCAIVVDEKRKPIGIFTESMLTEMLAHGTFSIDEPIGKHMAERCPWVRSTDSVADLLEAMQLKNVRMLCVVDKDNRVVGLTGQRGLMEYVADYFPDQVMVQRIGMTSYETDREGA